MTAIETKHALPSVPVDELGPNEALHRLVDDAIRLLRPKDVVVCDGTAAERNRLESLLVANGTVVRLNQKLWPNSLLARSDPSDVARLEQVTYVCLPDKQDAGPSIKHKYPEEGHREITALMTGAMEGRTMYVAAVSMGPCGGKRSRVFVQITDFPLIILMKHLMTRVLGRDALIELGKYGRFECGLQTVGMPIAAGGTDVPWPCNSTKMICHFPKERRPGVPRVLSFGSGYGGNALLPKKCDLRLAMSDAREEGNLVEHMALMGRDGENGRRYFLAAKPSACGKTNFAMIGTSFLGDDLVRAYEGTDGRLWAFALEKGIFGVAPGTNDETNPEVMSMLRKGDVIFINVAYLPESGSVWWEGMTNAPPAERVRDWQGQEWTPGCGRKAAHANSRFTVSIRNCSKLDPRWDDPDGVPVDAILFGGRRTEHGGVPLVVEYGNTTAGVYGGATLSSEQTAAADGKLGVSRIDPFAMYPFYAYHVGDHCAHWLKVFSQMAHPPRFYSVNWFQKDGAGNFAWPGFVDNDRVLDWIDRRIAGQAKALRTPLGYSPLFDDFDLSGLNIDRATFETLTQPRPQFWLGELDRQAVWFAEVGERLPAVLAERHAELCQLFEEAARAV